MTSQDKKAYLERYREADQEIDRLCEELSRWRARGTKIAPSLSSASAEGYKDEDLDESPVEKIISLEREINSTIDRAIEIKKQVEDTIKTVPNGTLRDILIRRYIFGETWEQISIHMNYGYRWILRLHGKALKLVEVK